MTGREVRQDLAKALDLLREAAQGGNALAQYHLGLCLIEGRGVPQDRAEGLRMVRQSASRGLADAQTYIRELPQ
jgi:TPR repeat protein